MQTELLFDPVDVQTLQTAPATATLAASKPKPKRKARTVHASVPLQPRTTVPDELILDADWLVISSSSGKDSQAMLAYVVRRAKALKMLAKVVVVHADLGRVEWEGTLELAELQARLAGVRRFEVVQAPGADLLERVEIRYGKLKAKAEIEAIERGEDPTTAKVPPAWPSSAARWCTPDVKRGPIWTLYTRLAAELAHLGRPVRILECIGQRAAESSQRAKLAEVEINRRASNGKRHVTTWRPIHAWSDRKTWREIARSRLPYHPAYDGGNRRLSCVFPCPGVQQRPRERRAARTETRRGIHPDRSQSRSRLQEGPVDAGDHPVGPGPREGRGARPAAAAWYSDD
ncbi:phosphoadenosine phosphosulfate reductase family protein [Streptomyces sp. NPDC059003]|uniref:phosphoadenosine phosphosulfate reductase domain-containing protein n=1 Tax=Streptomyces sp. NPDC059003 TaxID=3346691 RepID=UPI003697CD80